MNWDKDRWPNFSPQEFACPCPCGVLNVSQPFLDALQAARSQADFPFRITSGGRCPAYNMELRARGYKSVDGSAHTMTEETPCEAADIEVSDSQSRLHHLRVLLDHFDRIGVSSGFIHVDLDLAKPPDVLWTY